MPIVKVIDRNKWINQKSVYRKEIEDELNKLLYKGLIGTSIFILRNSAKDGEVGIRKESILSMFRKSIEQNVKIELNNLTQDEIDTLFDVITIINRSTLKALHQKYLDVKYNRKEEKKDDKNIVEKITAVKAIQELKKLGINMNKQILNNHRNIGRVELKKIGGRNYIENPEFERYKRSLVEEEEEI